MKKQRKMAQMKEQNKTTEKEPSKMDIANLSDAKFKTLVIRMLRELLEYGKKIKEEIKVTLKEITTHRKPTEKRKKLGFKPTICNIMKT